MFNEIVAPVSENVDGALAESDLEAVAGGVAPLLVAGAIWLGRAAAVLVVEEALEYVSRKM